MSNIDAKKHHYFYKITCTVTGKFYYGVHSTDELNDNYLGSGPLIRQSVREYGRHNHVREIIQEFSCRRDASEHERSIVTPSLLLDANCLNLQTGGDSCTVFSDETLRKLKKSDEQRRRISERRKGRATHVTEEQRRAHSQKVSGAQNGMFQAERPDSWRAEHSAKMKVIMAGRMPTGATKGRKWYHNPATLEERMLFEQPDGWLPGRHNIDRDTPLGRPKGETKKPGQAGLF